MMTLVNPYSPGKPIEQDHQFIDQTRVVEAVLRSLSRGKSCSIIGGVGMGKTSILKRVKRMFSQKANDVPTTTFRFIPIYFKPDPRKASSPRSIYQQLINETLSQTKDWLMNCVANVPKMVFDDLNFVPRLMESGPTTLDEDYRAFEGDLWEIIKATRHAVADTKLLFLLDEMYRIEDENTKAALARHWFELLDEENPDKERLRSHLAVIITCFKDHLEQFIPRRPNAPMWPIHAIEPTYLQVFEQADAWQVIKIPIKDTLGLELTEEVTDEIYNLTGGYPLLLHSTMSDLWMDTEMKKVVDINCVRRYVPTWSNRHTEMYRWIGDIISENQMLSPLFELLLSEDKIWERSKLTEALQGLAINLRYGHQLRDALWILKSLGVAREVRENGYQISGELFRDWFEPLSTARVNELNYKSQIEGLVEQMTKTIDQLDQHRDIDGIVKLRERLKDELTKLGTNRTQLVDLEESLSPENPMRADTFRRLIKDVQRIKYYMRFDIRLQLREMGIQIDDIGDNL